MKTNDQVKCLYFAVFDYFHSHTHRSLSLKKDMNNSISSLLAKVFNSIQRELHGSQQKAIECQLHVSPAKTSSNSVTTITQSRLLVHQDLEHEAIPEEDFDDSDDDDTLSALNPVNLRRTLFLPSSSSSSSRENGKDDQLLQPLQRPKSGTDESSVIIDAGTFLYVHGNRKHSQHHLSSRSPSSSSSSSSTATVLLAGDRAAGKTTFAAIASGLSLSTQRLLRLHATSLVNTWFQPSEQDLIYFMREFESDRKSEDDENLDSDSSSNNNNTNSAASAGGRRVLPLLPSQLCITSLHGLSEDWDLFLDDEELEEEVCDNIIIVAPSSYSFIRNNGMRQPASTSRSDLSSLSNFTTVRLVEVGGDLMEMMYSTKTTIDETNQLLLDSAFNAFSTAQRALYFFDANALLTKPSVSVSDFKFFLDHHVINRSTSSPSSSASGLSRLLLVISRAPISLSPESKETGCASCTSAVEDLFGIVSQTPADDKSIEGIAKEVTRCSNSLCFLRAFLNVAMRFARLKRVFNGHISGFIVPQFEACDFGKLEDATMFMLQQSLVKGEEHDDDDELSREDDTETGNDEKPEAREREESQVSNNLFHSSPVATDAKIAQLLFACHKLIERAIDDDFLQELQQPEHTKSLLFRLTIENCTKAIRFAFDSYSSSSSSCRHGKSCQMCEVTTKREQDVHDDFCLSRNFEYCPPLTLTRSIPFLLEVLENDIENASAIVRMNERKDLVISSENCSALYSKYERRTLMNGM